MNQTQYKPQHICTMCGNRFNFWDKQEAFGFHHNVGYGSTFDSSRIDVELCCDCFDKLMNTYILPRCKKNPITEELAVCGEEPITVDDISSLVQEDFDL